MKFDQLYPTRSARDIADKAIDLLDANLPMHEFIRIWELSYMEAGGVVRVPGMKKAPNP